MTKKINKLLLKILPYLSLLSIITSLILFIINVINKVNLIHEPLKYFRPAFLFVGAIILTACYRFIYNFHEKERSSDKNFYYKSMEMFSHVKNYDTHKKILLHNKKENK